jgi:hypothetical protein
MKIPWPMSHLPATLWTGRCVARIRDIDLTVSIEEADALARALWDSPGCRANSPEMSAERLFAMSANVSLS